MKKIYSIFLISAFVACSGSSNVDTVVEPSPYASYETLNKEECGKYQDWLAVHWKDSVRNAMQNVLTDKKVSIGQNTMRLDWKIFGDKPAEGRALYISLHGGGGAPAETNDGQWVNQMRLYQPAEGVYLCPRGITDTWDLHFRPESDTLYEAVIRMAVGCMDVNPDKVYLMGYSAGGDGVWRIAPRMADHWAAASMMAGHPGDVSLLSLRNLPFMIWCGALDNAYNRNAECAKKIQEMDALQAADPEGYIHEGHIVEGKGHWMDLEDAAAVPWMAKYKRNPYPDTVVWCQGDEPKTSFYWLGVPKDDAAKGKTVKVHIQGNTVVIDQCDYPTLTIYLNDKLVDLEQSVTVEYNGSKLFEGTLKRSPATMRSTLRERGDLSYIFPACVIVSL